MSFRGGAHTTQAREEALLEAGGTLVRPADGRTQTVKLKPQQIIIRAELFQPREFAFGGRDTDRRHVERLARRIKNVGELDPIVVIKLGRQWVCVDGHHRVTAYKKSKRTEEIKCEWFAGSVREAMDEGLRRNAALNLEVPLADRQEEAWKRVLLGGWTKQQIVKTCSIAEGTVSHMNRVRARYMNEDDDSDATKQFRMSVGKLKASSWSNARLVNMNAEPKERTDEQRAQSLAKNMRSRLTDMLSKDPTVTARALAIYDPDLPGPLIDGLTALQAPPTDEDD
jgi:hypothetical protein